MLSFHDGGDLLYTACSGANELILAEQWLVSTCSGESEDAIHPGVGCNPEQRLAPDQHPGSLAIQTQ
jgi:hypothetical protein